MVKLVPGSKKKSYKSIREAALANNIPYITLWMRVNKLRWPIAKAIKADVRQYNKREYVTSELVSG